jgi:hypothetical protein
VPKVYADEKLVPIPSLQFRKNVLYCQHSTGQIKGGLMTDTHKDAALSFLKPISTSLSQIARINEIHRFLIRAISPLVLRVIFFDATA